MPKICIQDASKAFLEGMAKSLARTIDAGRTHNEDGYPLAQLLDDIIAQIPTAPEYHVTHGRGRR